MSTVPERKRQFSSSLHSELTNLQWKIDDFQAMVDLVEPLKSLVLKFDAGRTIQLPTKWKFFFQTKDVKEGKLGFYLRLLKAPEDCPKVYATYELVIKDASGSNSNYSRSRNSYVYNAPAKDYKATTNWGFPDCFGPLSSLSTDLLRNANGTLVMDITFKVFNFEAGNNSTITTEALCNKKARFQEKLKNIVAEDFTKLFHERHNSDFKIVMKDGKEFPVHRVILASRSPVFLAMFESNMEEVASGIVQVEDLTSDAMEIVLKYIYSGTVDDKWKEIYEELIYAAEKYSLTFLKEFFDTMLSGIVTSENVIDLVKVAQEFKLETAEKELFEYAHQNFKEVFKSVISN